MPFNVRIIADSYNTETGDRLTSMELMYPRFIHAEFMTHRVFSRNASSSRAIPVAKMIEHVNNLPAKPVYWGKNQSGMQAREELSGPARVMAEAVWTDALQDAIKHAERMTALGVHKQVTNRLLEPFMHINVIVTSTEWSNFFALRSHPDAQPEIKVLSDKMQDALHNSTPMELSEGEWHLPYLTEEDYATIYADSAHAIHPEQAAVSMAILVSVARCARVSYRTHDNRRPGLSEDLLLAEKLLEADPPHLSPAEHQAFADRWRDPRQLMNKDYLRDTLHGNLRGFCQFRKIFEKGKG